MAVAGVVKPAGRPPDAHAWLVAWHDLIVLFILSRHMHAALLTHDDTCQSPGGAVCLFIGCTPALVYVRCCGMQGAVTEHQRLPSIQASF
jgi:hypothetical protein